MMNQIWGDGNSPPKVECLRCHRVCYATKDGYLPVHRVKGKRIRCDGSGASVNHHKKVGG